MRYTRFDEWRRRVFEKMTPMHWLVMGLGLILIITTIVFSATRTEPDPLEDSWFDQIRDRGSLRVGVWENAYPFSQLTIGDDGKEQWIGLEVDIAYKLAEKITGDANSIEFVSVDYTTRNIKLTQGMVDCLISMNPLNYSSSFLYSNSYYTDAVGIVVMQNGPQTLEDLRGKNVGVISRPGDITNEGARTALDQYNTVVAQKEINVKIYSSVPDLFEALRKGKVQAVALENAWISHYFVEEQMRILPEAIATIRYCVTARTDSQALIDLVNQTLAELKETEELRQLLEKWGLQDYELLTNTNK